MSAPGWRTSYVVHGVARDGIHAVPVVVGLVEGGKGGVFVVLRVGDDGDEVILPTRVGAQLIVNLREAMAEQLKATGETLGGDEP